MHEGPGRAIHKGTSQKGSTAPEPEWDLKNHTGIHWIRDGDGDLLDLYSWVLTSPDPNDYSGLLC